jgi:hypothetical protein
MQVRQQKRIEFRVGTKVGDIILDDDDIYGDGVNLFNFGEDLPSHRHGHRVWSIVRGRFSAAKARSRPRHQL